MTFDFAAGTTGTELPNMSAATPHRAELPPHSSMREVAALVHELFAEGTLSWDQVAAMCRLPELGELLSAVLAEPMAVRKTREALR